MEVPKCFPFYGQAWFSWKTFQVFSQQPLVHIELRRERSEASPCRSPDSAGGKNRPFLRAQLMFHRWQKCILIPVINNSGLLGLGLVCVSMGCWARAGSLAVPSFSHQTEPSQESISPTSSHQAPGERTGEGGTISHILSLSKCNSVSQFPASFLESSRAEPKPSSPATELGL